MRKRRVLVCVAVLALLGVVLFGRGALTRHARKAAERDLREGAISAAEDWLEWAADIDRDDPKTDLMRAVCFRELGERSWWQQALEAAERNGAGAELRIERALGNLRWGDGTRVSPGDYDALVERGAKPRDAASAVVFALLARGDVPQAEAVIADWSASADAAGISDQAHVAYLTALCARSAGQPNDAEQELEKALDMQPRHEVARAALAQLLEERNELERAHTQYALLAATAPDRESLGIDGARVLRKLGRLDEARAVLLRVSPAGTPAGDVRRAPANPSASWAIERGQIAYDAGHYDEAQTWFAKADLDGPHVADTLRAAAAAFALAGKAVAAEQLFARVDNAQSLSRQASEWRRRLALDPGDRVAAHELERLASTRANGAATAPAESASVLPLYVQLCAACHGVDGDGRGRAARHLWPRPRDLRGGRQRVVSTTNGIPSPHDIEQVIRRGIPGTAMPAFPELSPDALAALTRQVQQFRRMGVREQLLTGRDADTPDFDEHELREAIAALTTPGELLPVPEFGPADAQTFALGRRLYFEMGCRNCHGDDGRGGSNLRLVDEDGRVSWPRDLTRDPLKGGSSAESLFRRIRLGMPGTPHPAAASLSDAEITALVHFCLSLAESSSRQLTNRQRWMRSHGG